MKVKRALYTAVACLCLAVGAMAGIASGSATTSPKAHSSDTESTNATERPAAPGPGGPGAVHSVSVVPNKEGSGFDTVTMDSGTVQSVSGQQLTITEGTKSLTYKTVTLTISASATVQRDGKSAQLSELQAGDHVFVCENSDGTTMVNAADSSFKPTAGGGAPGGQRGPGGPPPGSGQGTPGQEGSGS